MPRPPHVPMSREWYLNRFHDVLHTMALLTERKNADYAAGDDAFQNFRMVELMGLTTVETGILTRMTDKLQRVVNLTRRPAAVPTESITDTLQDLAVYAVILMIYLEHAHSA